MGREVVAFLPSDNTSTASIEGGLQNTSKHMRLPSQRITREIVRTCSYRHSTHIRICVLVTCLLLVYIHRHTNTLTHTCTHSDIYTHTYTHTKYTHTCKITQTHTYSFKGFSCAILYYVAFNIISTSITCVHVHVCVYTYMYMYMNIPDVMPVNHSPPLPLPSPPNFSI